MRTRRNRPKSPCETRRAEMVSWGGMAITLAFIHTGHVLIPVFGQLAKELLPGVDVFHMLDESLIRNTIASGGLNKLTIRRLLGMIESARQGGADAVMVTCSSIGQGVAIAREQFDFPILGFIEAWAERAWKPGAASEWRPPCGPRSN